MLPIAYLFHRAILLKRADRVIFPCKSSSHYIQTKYSISTRIKRKRFERTRVTISYFSIKFINSYPRSRIYLYIYIYSFRLKLHQFLIHQSLLDSYLNFSVNSWYTWYIYLYTLSRFRSIIKVEYKRDRNDGAKHDAGKHGWWRDERPRTTAAKKSVFFAAAAWSGMARRGEARRETRV